MHANEPEMAKDWEKKESLKENRTKLVKNLMQVYKDLDKKFKNYDHTHIRDWGKVTKHLTKKFGGNKKLASHIALSYNDYRGGEDIKKNITNLIKYAQKMTGKKLEATTSSVIPPYDTPKAFKKSTYKAIQVDDEDDSDELIGGMRDARKRMAKLDKKESVNERKLSSHQKKAIEIAVKMSGNMTGAVKKIEKIKRGLSNDKKVKDALRLVNESIKVRNGEVAKEGKWKVYDSHSGKTIKEVGSSRAATRLMNRLMSSGQYKEITTKWVGETVNEADDHELEMAHGQLERSIEYSQMILKKLQDGGYDELPGWVQGKLTKSMDYLQSVFNYYDGKDGLDEKKKKIKIKGKWKHNKLPWMRGPGKKNEKVNEDFWALPANWSTQEAKLHLDKDIKDMSRILGKASQQVIKIMMNGVKGGKYDALDIVRGIETGPWNRTHEGERPFMKMLWRKVRNGFRRYSKDRKLRK